MGKEYRYKFQIFISNYLYFKYEYKKYFIMFSSVPPEIWFDDVDEIFIERATPIEDGKSSAEKVNPLVRPNSFEGYVLFTLIDIAYHR